MILGGRQINPIDVNFHLQSSLENWDKNSAGKILSKYDKGVGKLNHLELVFSLFVFKIVRPCCIINLPIYNVIAFYSTEIQKFI